MRIVCDTGPLLHLREADSLELLASAGQIAIPPAVYGELVRHNPFWSDDRPDWIELATLEEFSLARAARWLQAGLLDPGEAEALALAVQIRADWLLTDDSAARWVAEQQGLEVHGSLGVVLWGAATGRLTREEAEASLGALSQSSLWISPRLLAEAKSALQQIFS